ncbi:hypothetical protein [Cellulosimicrobium sp. I38E]|uniref:hypothetical protein n=1 Tax=Cellulosimicrobium sp. I38E TaxID=1393139 RepID=UPI0007B21B42|nr:hypothetical protein [Cellulosimicrobium sp. I38E]KZM78369.1 hypothetical protein A0J59_13635 [Cellulosimicrobium sp. I38E]
MSTSTTTLRDLAQRAVDERGLSGRRLADLAREHGFELTHSTFNWIRSGTYKSRPSPETVKAIAWLAGVPAAEAFTAAGLPVPGPPFADELPPGVDNLSPRKRKVVIDLLRVLIEDEERDGDDRDAAPTKRAAGSAAVSEQDTPEAEASDDESSDGPRKHWTPVTEADIRAGAALPRAEGHGRKKRTTGRTKPRHT